MSVQVMSKMLLAEGVKQVFDLNDMVMVLTVSDKIYTLGPKADGKPKAALVPMDVAVMERKKPGPKGPRKPKLAAQEQVPDQTIQANNGEWNERAQYGQNTLEIE